MMHRTLIAGYGDLGQHIARTIAQRDKPGNHVVYGLARRQPASTCAGGITRITADLTRPETLLAIPQDVSHVVYCVSADASTESAYQSSYFDGLRNLVDQLATHPVMPRILFVSSTAVYGRATEGLVDENTPAVADRFNGKIMLAAEQMLLGCVDNSVVLRLSGIYGPGRTYLLRRLMAGGASIPEQEGYWANRIHIEDAARAVVHLLFDTEQTGVFIGSDSTPLPLDKLYLDLAAQIGAPSPIRGPASPMMGRKRLSNSKLLGSGFRFKWPDSRIGYQPIIDAFLANSDIEHAANVRPD